MSTRPMATEFAADEIRIFSLLRGVGFTPDVIYDIGAANGTWSALVNAVFPNARFELFEPLGGLREDYRQNLKYQLQCNANFSQHDIALGERDQIVEMSVDESGYGSTIFDMGDHPDYRRRLKVNQYTLDGYIQSKRIPLPDLLKIDTQGAERIILNSGPKCVEHAKVIFVETWFIRGYGPKTPLLHELIELLSGSGFLLTEIGHRFYDARHGLYGCDAFFLKEAFLNDIASRMPTDPW